MDKVCGPQFKSKLENAASRKCRRFTGFSGSLHGISSPSRRRRSSGGVHTITPVRWDGRTHPLGESLFCTKPIESRSIARRFAHGQVHERDRRLASDPDCAMGQFLSLEIYSIVGIGLLFFDRQLLDGRFWRCSLAACVANFGSTGEHHWCLDVWALCEFPVRARDPACSARGPVRTGAGEGSEQ